MPRSPVSGGSPREIAQYEILGRLGTGGMAEVFLAKKPGAEGTYKLLVLKRILPMHGSSRRFRAMFIEEARLATRLNHPNVVQVYELQDFGDDGLLLAMEYVEGCDLGKLMRAVKSHDSRIPPWHAAWVVAEAAKGLHYAHERKDEKGLPLDIVHRDVSPQNILVSFDGAVKIADFGIASGRELADDQGVLKGKFGYMSPEQARGEPVDRRSDLYALGVILWELLAGRPLHGGLGGEALLDIVRSGIVEPPAAHAKEVPPELADISMKALSPERADRYATGRELAAAVARELARQGSLPDVGAFDNTVGQLVSRAVESEPLPSRPDSVERSDDVRTQAAVPHARSSVPPHSNPNLGGVAIEPSPAESPGHEPREVRHVAVIALRLSDLERASKHRRFEHLRSMLDHLAFKRGARWAWDNNGGARAIVGLGANAARAALDAAYLALDTHEALSGSNEDPELPLAAAIGIVRGIASGTRDPQGHLVRYTLHRPTELLADVLERATAIAQTWVAGGLYRLVRRDFVWSDLPSLELDPGLGPDVPISMRVYALHRSLSPEERNAAQPGGAGDLVGRDAEKADLHAAFHQAVHGRTQSGQLSCRAIVGEMGIGKSAVVEAFLEELPAETRSVRIECTPVGTEIPFSALAGLVRNAVGASGEEPIEDVAALVAKIGGAAAGGDPTNPIVMRLAELATNRRSGGGDEDAYARRRSILSAFRNLLAAIALERPIVVVVDGMQWADRPSIEVLCEFVRGADPLPILALLVTRPDEHIMPALEGIMRVELTGLSVDEQVRLVGAHLGVSDGVQHACSDLLTRAGGNPFFLLELIDALLERGALEIRETEEVEGKKVASLERTDREDVSFRALPSTLEQLLADRLAELPALEHSIVDWLAIAGGPLSLSDVLELSGVKDPETIDRLGARGVCDRRGELVDFRHPLARDVAYAALDPMDRVRMHRQLGERLSRTSLARGLSAAIVARHLARGESYERAAEFYLEAATAAREGHQNQLVVRYCNRALSYLGPDDKRRVEVHEALESIYRVLGRRRERAWHLEALRRGVRRVANARAVCLGLLRSARFDLDEGHLSRGAEIARQATEVAHAAKIDVLKVEAEALTSNLLRELGDVQGAVAACDRALAAFESPSVSKIPPLLEAEVLRSRGILLRRVGRIREAVDSYLDAIAISRKCGARRMEARVKNALAYAMFVQGRYEDAVALALESIQIDLSMGGRFQLAKTLTTVGQSYFRLGDVRRSLAYLAHARKVHEMYRDQDGWAETLLVSAHVAVELGDFDSAETFVRDASAHTTATGNAYEKVYQEVIEALVSRESRLPSDAVRHSIAARQDAERASLVAFHFLAMAIEAMARVDLGEMHTAILLATTALGAVENLQGCEYGLEIRSFCADALKRAGSPQAPGAHQRAVDHATAMMLAVRDARLRGLFPRRPLHATLFETTSVPTHSLDDGSLASPAGAPRTS